MLSDFGMFTEAGLRNTMPEELGIARFSGCTLSPKIGLFKDDLGCGGEG